MDTDPDGPENATETDTLVSHEDAELCEESLEEEGGSEETSTLLRSSMAARHDNPAVDEADSAGKAGVSPPRDKSHQPHPYHLRNKYTFRSDSVYSDVIPMSAASQQHQTNNKSSESREKSGSLSSLKGKQESKWVTLKKKLGKLNSHSHSHHSHDKHGSGGPPGGSAEEAKDKAEGRPGPIKSLNEKRSLFQRAKTLAILPVHKAPKDKVETPPKRVIEPKELFNVGGEMNLIPLELLIDVNDLNIGK